MNTIYTPVLRWRQAEKEALSELPITMKAGVLPLLEILMPQAKYEKGKTKSPTDLLNESREAFKVQCPKISSEIKKYWGTDLTLMDVNHVDASLRSHSLEIILESATTAGIKLIPVVGLSYDQESNGIGLDYGAKNHGVGIRLFIPDLMSSTLNTDIQKIVDASGIPKEKIDLIIDLKLIDDNFSVYIKKMNLILSLNEWRNLIVVGGSFPIDLTDFSIDVHKIPRKEWSEWNNKDNFKGISRIPTFGDYTIQHPFFRTLAPGASPSASIRYCIENEWMILRGQSLRSEKGAGFAQYPAWASHLISLPEFSGKDFSKGDEYIHVTGQDINNKKTGNPKTWLRAGINHHLVFVFTQLSN